MEVDKSMVLDKGGNLPTSSEGNLSFCDESRLEDSNPENIDENRIVEDNLKGAEKSTVLDTPVDINCGQVDEEMTPSSPSGLPLDVTYGDNTLDQGFIGSSEWHNIAYLGEEGFNPLGSSDLALFFQIQKAKYSS
ncbi:unnamed protein product [Lepeophtheirus salmonis]|uniref:(salmon louse) hypothetical protein n=1 Tax=Lepeophtheirus salmonis TaxID=72036 RepID=A0A7R8CPD0_LEPSM|nr:unnamed protein product [Lepeophtheirus salmonis]CAF2838678.1 unnamed protein product [Lepeophtheirus salmonis]